MLRCHLRAARIRTICQGKPRPRSVCEARRGQPRADQHGEPDRQYIAGPRAGSARLAQDTFNRDIYPTAGGSYQGETEDYGISGELNWDFGNVNLTSITAYREYSNFQGSDTDYTTVDLLYRAPDEFGGARSFETFTQELRLNGTLFDDRFDWLVGGYYANEKLRSQDNLRFGTQYGTFANCRIALLINPALANPAADNCFGPNIACIAGTVGAFGPATPLIIAGINNLAQVRDVGGTGDIYNQKARTSRFSRIISCI